MLLSSTDLQAYSTFPDVIFKPRPKIVQGLPVQWAFSSNGTKLLALVGFAPRIGGEFEDHAFVEFEIGSEE